MVPCAAYLHSSQSGLPQERQKATAWVSGWFGQVISFPYSFLWLGCCCRRLLHRQPFFIHGFLNSISVLLTFRGRGLFLVLLLVPLLQPGPHLVYKADALVKLDRALPAAVNAVVERPPDAHRIEILGRQRPRRRHVLRN